MLKKALLALIIAVALPTIATAATPDATLTLDSKSVAAGIGVSWGDGEIKKGQETRKFSISGLSVIDLGISSASAVGEVYNLTKIEDLEGTFTSFKGELALAGGVGGSRMKNQNGVIIHLKSTKQGVKLSLAPEGMKVKLK